MLITFGAKPNAEELAGTPLNLVPTNLPRREIYARSEAQAQCLGYTPNTDLAPLISNLGGSFRQDECGCALTVVAPGNFLIYLNPYSGDNPSHNSLALALGHYILHSDSGRVPLRVPRANSGLTEWEAQWFALGFLIPEAPLREKLQAGWGEAELAEFFHVSQAAISLRREEVA